MVYTLPEDPLTRGLNRAIGSASKSISSGFQKGMANKREKNKVNAHGQFLMKSLGIDPESEEGQAISNAPDYDSLIAIGNSISKGADNSKKDMQEKQKSINTDYDNANKDMNELYKDTDQSTLSKEDYLNLKQNLRKEQKANKKAISNGEEISTDFLDNYYDSFIPPKKLSKKEKKAAEKEAKAAPKEVKKERPLSETGKMIFDMKNTEDKKQAELFLKVARGNQDLANEMLSEIYD